MLHNLMTQKVSGAADAVYYPGDEVLFKEKDTSKWSGPATVTGVAGNKVRMIYGGYERTDSSIDVAHLRDEKNVEEPSEHIDTIKTEIQTEHLGWQEDQDLPGGWQLSNNIDVRPKLNDRLKYSWWLSEHWKSGQSWEKNWKG